MHSYVCQTLVNMHPKIQAFYNQTGLDYVPTVYDRLEKDFNKATIKRDKIITVEKIYRVKLGGLRSHEYVWYVEKKASEDNKGNEISIETPIGKFEMPHAQYELDDDGNPAPRTINNVTTEYEIPWSPKLIEEFEEKGMITDSTQCYVDNGSRKYGQFYIDNFKAKDFEDLVYFGQTGRFPTKEEKEVLTGPPSKRMGFNEKQKES